LTKFLGGVEHGPETEFSFGDDPKMLSDLVFRLWSHPTCWRYINKSIIITVRIQESEVLNPHSLDYRKSYQRILMKFYEELRCGLETNWLHIGVDPKIQPPLLPKSITCNFSAPFRLHESWGSCEDTGCTWNPYIPPQGSMGLYLQPVLLLNVRSAVESCSCDPGARLSIKMLSDLVFLKCNINKLQCRCIMAAINFRNSKLLPVYWMSML